jgi:hypothetical protein
MRGSHGRSIARALAGILLLAAFLTGFNAGAIASAAPGFPICSAGSVDHGTQPGSSHTHIPDCCLAGHMPTAMAPPPVASPAATEIPRGAAAVALASSQIRLRQIDGGTGPRGPPLLT